MRNIPTLTDALAERCRTGCAGPCRQGRLNCSGLPRAIPPTTRWVMRNPSGASIALALAVGAIATIAAAAWVASLTGQL